MKAGTAERLLKLLFRVSAGFVGLAAIAVFLPLETMARIHREVLGMGELPEGPVVEYLARSLSFFYFSHAPLYLLAASDLQRYRPLALYFGWFNLALGLLLLVVDLVAGMPASWTWSEGPSILLVGLAILWLLRRVPRRHPAG